MSTMAKTTQPRRPCREFDDEFKAVSVISPTLNGGSTQPLMVVLSMIMIDELGDGPSRGS